MGFIINNIIKKQKTKVCLIQIFNINIFKLENDPSSYIFYALIGQQLYGDVDEELTIRLNKIETMNQLKKESNDFWRNLFVKTFTNDFVCVMAVPSIEAVEKITKIVEFNF